MKNKNQMKSQLSHYQLVSNNLFQRRKRPISKKEWKQKRNRFKLLMLPLQKMMMMTCQITKPLRLSIKKTLSPLFTNKWTPKPNGKRIMLLQYMLSTPLPINFSLIMRFPKKDKIQTTGTSMKTPNQTCIQK